MLLLSSRLRSVTVIALMATSGSQPSSPHLDPKPSVSWANVISAGAASGLPEIPPPFKNHILISSKLCPLPPSPLIKNSGLLLVMTCKRPFMQNS